MSLRAIGARAQRFAAWAAILVMAPNVHAAGDHDAAASKEMQTEASVTETASSDASEARAPQPSFPRTLRWLGRLHILVVHFPIALLSAAAIAELWSLRRRQLGPSAAVRFCVLLGAASAVLAVALGWLHADWGGFGADSPELLRSHRWAGTVLGACAVATAFLSERDARRGRRSYIFWVFLGASAVLTGVVGHLGGTLVHGSDFLNW